MIDRIFPKMTSPCANYYVSFHSRLEVYIIDREQGSVKCRNSVLIFGARCDFCMVCSSQAQLSRSHADPEYGSRPQVLGCL
jgi:hypothetical protein